MPSGMHIDENGGDQNKKNASRLYLVIGLSVAVISLSILGIGIGIGYGIWNDASIPQATPETQKTTEPTKPSWTSGSDIPNKPTTPQTTPKPAKHWIDTPCISGSQPRCPPGVDKPPLILVSLDGFRADLLYREFTPHIKRLSDCGVHTPYMLPVFPTVTFSNHYAIATGLFPEHNGLISNAMYDPVLEKWYYLSTEEKYKNDWYWGEPIWNTAMKQGLRTGCYFWVGSDVDVQDMRPNYYFQYNGDTTAEQKIDTIRGWLQLPTGKRPDLITLYFDEPDKTGHQYGPDSDEQNKALEKVDGYIGDLMDALLAVDMHECASIIILADHGMANRSCEDAAIILGDPNGKFDFDFTDYDSDYTSGTMMRYTSKPTAALKEPREVVDRLKCRDPAAIPYVKQDMPKRFHYMNNRRIEDILIPVEQGYTISNNFTTACNGAGHGYDNLAVKMQSLFLAYGPVFKENLAIEPFQNVELFSLMCDILGLSPPTNDGEYGSLHHILENPPPLPPSNKANYSEALSCPYPGSEQEYSDRLLDDSSLCVCQDMVSNETNKTIQEFDEQLNLSDDAKLALKSKHAMFGMPEVSFKTEFCELFQQDYITGYSHQLKMPLYTTFTIDKKQLRGTSPDVNCAIRPDVRVGADITPKCSDYNVTDEDFANITVGFSYSPGLTETLEAKMDSLIISNMVPQFAGFIQDIWSGYLDVYLPKWADSYNGINVVTGPIFDYDFDGFRDPIEVLMQKGLKLQDTFIPTHYFVVITMCSDTPSLPLDKNCSKLNPLAFILHNKDGIQTCQSPSDYMETNIARVKDVELLTGLKFYSNLDPYAAIRLRTFIQERIEFFKYWDKY
ncbi:venom phosphodiesterase 2-like [Asterias rubens]|uniref:venom phosphodiesterase 2-like n=1 Tax=Asterias rubens TaxID=7604 RepID=UPI0014552E91|nr:venom phosphodiesterase 2-like [Asterias rubens]